MILDSKGEVATVIKTFDHTVIVELDHSQTDSLSASHCVSCGARILCSPEAKGKRTVKVSNHCQAKVGDRVLISENESFLFKISIFQYMVPLGGFIAGILGFSIIDRELMFLPKELLLFIGGIIGLSISALAARYFLSRMLGKKIDTIFTIEKIIQE
jgi:positive regulator of sigma E activity